LPRVAVDALLALLIGHPRSFEFAQVPAMTSMLVRRVVVARPPVAAVGHVVRA
jgi:hypothetical protein